MPTLRGRRHDAGTRWRAVGKPPPLGVSLPPSPSNPHSRSLPPSTISGSAGAFLNPLFGARRTGPANYVRLCRRKPPHTTHHQHFPERVTITRSHHPFQGQSLEVLRQARMPGGLQFVLILPDGSKSLIPAEWTDFNNTSDASQSPELVGSLDDLLRLRGLVDALLRRATDVPLTSGA